MVFVIGNKEATQTQRPQRFVDADHDRAVAAQADRSPSVRSEDEPGKL